jgi:uncharacterized membrane protein YdbT with pleckstrin-like domain
MCPDAGSAGDASERMGYVDQIVTGSEKVLYTGHVSLLSLLGTFLLGGVLIVAGIGLAFVPQAIYVGLALIAVGALVVVAGLVKRASTELAVTNKRVIAKFGLVSRRTIELNLSKLESIRVDQSVGGRIFNYGSIVVVGTGATLEPIPFIAAPMAFRQAVQSAADDVQVREPR